MRPVPTRAAVGDAAVRARALAQIHALVPRRPRLRRNRRAVCAALGYVGRRRDGHLQHRQRRARGQSCQHRPRVRFAQTCFLSVTPLAAPCRPRQCSSRKPRMSHALTPDTLTWHLYARPLAPHLSHACATCSNVSPSWQPPAQLCLLPPVPCGCLIIRAHTAHHAVSRS